eukprot:424544_1
MSNEEKESKCDGTIKQCSYLCRIISALQKYEISVQSHDGQNEHFIQFCIEYEQLLNDYIHLHTTHNSNNALSQIGIEILAHNGIKKCTNVIECQFMQRYYDRENGNSIVDENDFYLEIFDTLHCNAFHLQELKQKHNAFGLERVERFNIFTQFEEPPKLSKQTELKQDIQLSNIKFKWDPNFKRKQECDTKHMLYLVCRAINKVNLKSGKRNVYFTRIGRKDRIRKQLNQAKIMTNILRWHNKPGKKNEFDGELYKNADNYVITTLLSRIGGIRMGDATKIIYKLRKEITIESSMLEVGNHSELEIPTHGYSKMKPADKHLEDCSVENIGTLLGFRKNDSNAVNVFGVFETIIHMKNNKWPSQNVENWETKIIDIFNRLNIDGKTLQQTNRKKLIEMVTNAFKNAYNVEVKMGDIAPIITQLQKCNVHGILAADSQIETTDFANDLSVEIKEIQKQKIYKEDDTSMDIIFDKLIDIKFIDLSMANKLKDWLDLNEYDTDSLQYDINEYDVDTDNICIKQCNLSFMPNKIIGFIYRFIRYKGCSDINKYWLYRQKSRLKSNETTRYSTFTDDLLLYVARKDKDKENKCKVLDILRKCIVEQKYDTDAILEEISFKKNGYLYKTINNVEYMNSIKIFANHYNKTRNILSNTFTTGFVFWYWPYYENNLDKQLIKMDQSWVSNKVYLEKSNCDLYVRKKYASLKAEVEAFFEQNHWPSIVNKGVHYVKTVCGRKIKNVHSVTDPDPLNYGLKYKALLEKRHLYSIILYCNYTKLCREFRKTFRKLRWNETILDVKRRNSAFFHVSKNLREVVQYYGRNNNLGGGAGPFYCGTDMLLNISTFAININGPLSTSTSITVAARFGSGGMILQLNNMLYPAKYENYFDVSWISAFKDEDECIFCGGLYKMQIESVRKPETRENFQKFFKAFFKFDSLLSGQEIRDLSKRDVTYIKAAVNNYCGIANKIELHHYIIDSFYAFCVSKTK